MNGPPQDDERRPPGGGTASEAAGRPEPTVQPPSDTSEDRRALAHAREVRRIVRRPWRACGCGWRGHDNLCAWGLTEDARAELAARLARDPFPRPRISADAELALIVRVRGDREYAEAVLARFVEMFTGPPS